MKWMTPWILKNGWSWILMNQITMNINETDDHEYWWNHKCGSPGVEQKQFSKKIKANNPQVWYCGKSFGFPFSVKKKKKEKEEKTYNNSIFP